METDEGQERRKATSPLKIRLIGFLILSAASIILLKMLGASLVLILEVFSLAGILALSAVLIVIVLGGRSLTIRKRR